MQPHTDRDEALFKHGEGNAYEHAMRLSIRQGDLPGALKFWC